MNGLINLGNTCYMNSIIQCISHLNIFDTSNEAFIKDYQKVLHKNDTELIEQWLILQKSLRTSNANQRINPIDFYKSFIIKLKKDGYYFVGFDQNDAGEFMTILFDLLHKCLQYRINISINGETKNALDKIAVNSIQSWSQFFKNEYSYIVKSTYSQLLSITNCPLCNYSTHNHDPIQIITLHMKESLKTLYDLLTDFVKMEVLDNDNTWKCDKCQERVNPEKKNIFWNLSDVLIFQIKRYNNNLTKNNGHIKFPLLLKMGRFCMNYNESSTQYELCAISIQMGSLNGGHYIAICKDGDQWNVYNDTSVFKIELDELLQRSPYCLFYKRI